MHGASCLVRRLGCSKKWANWSQAAQSHCGPFRSLHTLERRAVVWSPASLYLKAGSASDFTITVVCRRVTVGQARSNGDRQARPKTLRLHGRSCSWGRDYSSAKARSVQSASGSLKKQAPRQRVGHQLVTLDCNEHDSSGPYRALERALLSRRLLTLGSASLPVRDRLGLSHQVIQLRCVLHGQPARSQRCTADKMLRARSPALLRLSHAQALLA